MYKIIFWAMSDDEPFTSNNLGILEPRFNSKKEARKYFLQNELKTLEAEWKESYNGDKEAKVSFDDYDEEFDVFEMYGEDTVYTCFYKIVEC